MKAEDLILLLHVHWPHISTHTPKLTLSPHPLQITILSERNIQDLPHKVYTNTLQNRAHSILQQYLFS